MIGSIGIYRVVRMVIEEVNCVLENWILAFNNRCGCAPIRSPSVERVNGLWGFHVAYSILICMVMTYYIFILVRPLIL